MNSIALILILDISIMQYQSFTGVPANKLQIEFELSEASEAIKSANHVFKLYLHRV